MYPSSAKALPKSEAKAERELPITVVRVRPLQPEAHMIAVRKIDFIIVTHDLVTHDLQLRDYTPRHTPAIETEL